MIPPRRINIPSSQKASSNIGIDLGKGQSFQTTNVISVDSGRGQNFLILGPPGSGKTSLCAEFPDPYFIIEEKETGVLDLIDAGIISCNYNQVNRSIKSWMDLMRFNDAVLTGSHTFPAKVQTLIYESLSGFEQECHRYCCATRYNNNWDSTRKGFMFYQEGYKTSAKEFWSIFVQQCCQLRERGYNVILTGHTQKVMEKNVDDSDYMVLGGSCNQYTADVMLPYFQNVFFLDSEIDVKKESDHARGKAVNATKKIFCVESPWRKAKNRYKITEDIIITKMQPKDIYHTFCRCAKLNPATLRFVR